MSKFNAEEYKKKLQESTSCETCEKVPLPKLKKNTRYIFISYSHKDYKKVYSDLVDLYVSDIPFWYDEGLPAGKNWDDVVREKMTDSRCSGIIFYLSENLFLSRSIETEISIALGEDEVISMPGIKKDYFCVNITDLSPSKILKGVYSKKDFPDTEDEMKAQFNWVEMLQKAFPDKATYLSFNNPHHRANLVEQIGVVFSIIPNYNPYDFSNAIFCSGKAKIKFENGVIYDGEFLNGNFHGNGKMEFPNNAVYEGGWEKGKRHGNGKMLYVDGTIYEGGWKEGKYHGIGRKSLYNGTIYEGNWKEGKPHGKGKTISLDGTIYEGEWKEGKYHGKGKCEFPNGIVYKGEWKEGKPNGKGEVTYSNGDIYDGDWVDGKDCGQCTYIRKSDGHKYVGGWGENGSLGYGIYIYPDGASRSGNWDGTVLLDGEGVMRYDDGSAYDGQIKNNKRHGYGTFTLPDGTTQTGYFENDKFIGPKL